jgi:hypothetical protein
MTNNVFTVRNVFCPHKDYSNFLDGKLTMFKLCNYGKGMVWSLKLFQIILLFIKLILLFVNFSRTIRDASVYFVVYALFSYLCLVYAWVGYFDTAPMDMHEGWWLLRSIVCRYTVKERGRRPGGVGPEPNQILLQELTYVLSSNPKAKTLY